MAKLPQWSVFWGQYYDYINFTSPYVKEMIGGAVNASWITNTCAIRMSYAMNYIGFPIPKGFPNLNTIKGGDGMRYSFRVRELRPWLRHTFGAPDFEVKKKANEAFDRKQIESMLGLIAFDINFKDATGHLDATFNGTFSSEGNISKDYFALATKVSIWKCA